MKKFTLILLMAVFAAAVYAASSPEDRWITYKNKFGKKYGHDEDIKRFRIFKQKLDVIEDHNQKFHKGENRSWKDDVDQYTDFTEDEYRKLNPGKPDRNDHDHKH